MDVTNKPDGLNAVDADASANTNTNLSVDTPKAVDYAEFQKVVQQRQAEKKARKELEDKLQAIEKGEAEKQGEYKKLYESSAAKYEELRTSWLKDKVTNSVQSALLKAGCADAELALAAGKSELLEFDENEGKVDGVDAWIEELKQRKPILFQSVKTPTINPSTPGGGLRETAMIQGEDLSKLSSEQILNKLRSMARK
jgi:deoxyribodipyrimidine photolyase